MTILIADTMMFIISFREGINGKNLLLKGCKSIENIRLRIFLSEIIAFNSSNKYNFGV